MKIGAQAVLVAFAAPVFTASMALGQVPAPNVPDVANCVSQIHQPAYSGIARIAAITGSVSAHFVIDASGKVEELRLDGHPILQPEVEAAIRKTDFPAACQSQNFDVTFRFRIEGAPAEAAKTSVAFNPPNEYIVTSNETGIICICRADIAKSRKRPAGHR